MANEKDSKDGKQSAAESFKLFIWNPNTREFCGRTGSSWVKILIFYIIFYLCLAAFWAIMLLIFYQTINNESPKWQGAESRIGTNPGLGFRPRPPPERVESTLIEFQRNNQDSWNHYVSDLEEFLKPYKEHTPGSGEHISSRCSPGEEPEPGKYCMFDISKINDNCTKAQNYGYGFGTPCILIKLNRIYGWKPEPLDEQPQDWPLGQKFERGIIQISCQGENAADVENIGPVEYYPSAGIPLYYFPFTNQQGYISPFVFVHFSKPTSNVLINVECKAWAKNIRHDRTDREGSVHFELMID